MFSKKAIIFSAPSGAGKTTLVRHLLEQGIPLEFSISACSRLPRANEQDGKDYHFLSLKDFKEKIATDAFLEWEEVYEDMFYGTLKSEVERIWKSGKQVLFDVDVVGGINIKKHFGEQALSIFVAPPSIEELKNRLEGRGTETAESLQKRLGKAEAEIAQQNELNVHVAGIEINEGDLLIFPGYMPHKVGKNESDVMRALSDITTAMNKFYEQLDYYASDLARDKQDKERYPDNKYMGREAERRGKEIARMSNTITSGAFARVW